MELLAVGEITPDRECNLWKFNERFSYHTTGINTVIVPERTSITAMRQPTNILRAAIRNQIPMTNDASERGARIFISV
jgi:hypothetical protein